MSYNPRHITLNNGGVKGLLKAVEMANRNAQAQRTSNSGTHFIPSGEIGEDGMPQGTLIGPGSQNGSVTQWVNDTTPPPMPKGLTVFSKTSMIFVTWDGTLEGDIPVDFDHVSIIVDGEEKAQMTTAGTFPVDAYEPGSEHDVTARAWDNAHNFNGEPKPNGSGETQPVKVKVESAVDTGEIDRIREQAQAALDEAAKKNGNLYGIVEPSHDGRTIGDVWYKTDSAGHVIEVYFWDGSAFVKKTVVADSITVPGSVGAVSIADGAVNATKVSADEALLKKLLVRKLTADEVEVGKIAAAMVQGSYFITPDGRTGFDSNGFWSHDESGNVIFKANKDGVQASGGFVTAPNGDRIQLSQTLIQGTDTGGLQGIGDDPNHPYWLIWGNHNGNGVSSNSNLFMGTSPQQPQFNASSSSSGNTASMTGTNVTVNGSRVNLDSSDLRSNGIDISNVDYKIDDIMGFWSNIQNYRGFMKLYKRAGVYYLDFNVQVRDGGKFPQNKLTPCIEINDSVRSMTAIDAWGYGSYGDVARVHVFGSGESYVPGTVSVTVKGSNVDYVSCQLHWTR